MQVRHSISADSHQEAGITVERRSVLRAGSWLGWSMAMTLMRLGGKPSRADEKAIADIVDRLEAHDMVSKVQEDVQGFLREVMPNEESYLYTVGRLLDRVRSSTPWRIFSVGEDMEIDMSVCFPPVLMYEVRMEPHAITSLHDHRYYNGVLVVTEGDARVRNFELVETEDLEPGLSVNPQAVHRDEILIRETKDQRLSRKRSSALTQDRDNIHIVEAGEKGCVLLDFFTCFRPGARSHELDWDTTPVDAQKKIYRAVWRTDHE
jgi:hypothetical protein